MTGLHNWHDEYRGVVHMGSTACGYEFTLCGYAYDEPNSEHGADDMKPTSAPCTCAQCISIAKTMLPYIRREIKRTERTDTP